VRELKLLAAVFTCEVYIILPAFDIMPTLPDAANFPFILVGDCPGDPGEFGPVDLTAEEMGELLANCSYFCCANLTKLTACWLVIQSQIPSHATIRNSVSGEIC
jgi:hypothetical protein